MTIEQLQRHTHLHMEKLSPREKSVPYLRSETKSQDPNTVLAILRDGEEPQVFDLGDSRVGKV